MAIARREDSVGCKRARISSVPAGIPLTGGVPPGACCGTTNRCHHSWPADAGMAGAGTAGAGTAGAGMGRVGMVRAGAGEAGGGAAYHDDGAAGACGGPAGRSHQFGTPGEVEDSTFIPYGGKNIMIRPSYGFAQLHNNRSLMWSAMNMGPPPEGYYRGMGPPGFPVDRSPCGDLDYFGLEEAAGKCVSGGAGDAGERPAGVASTAGPPSWPPAARPPGIASGAASRSSSSGRPGPKIPSRMLRSSCVAGRACGRLSPVTSGLIIIGRRVGT